MNRPTLQIIHGLIGTLDCVDPALRLPRANVRTVDLLGYGSYRDINQRRLTLRSQAEHVLSVIEGAGSEPVWLLGHSMGGAVAMIMADLRPELVLGIINVEGNFTLKDAFWAGSIAAKTPERWSQDCQAMQADVPATLTRWGLEPTPSRIDWAAGILDFQPAGTLHAMSRAIVKETGDPAYMALVRSVVDGGIGIHLIAGERSAAAWDVPDFVRAAARSDAEIAGTGHLMMLEKPEEFFNVVDGILARPL